MNLLTVDQLREHVETDLEDDALTRIGDAAEAEIIRRLGALASQTEVLQGGSQYLHLGRAASSITSISERYVTEGGGYTTTALSPNDYRLLSDGRMAERLFNGTNPAPVFQGEVTIVYAPVDTQAERISLLVKLVKLEIAYTGLASQSVGDVRAESVDDYNEEKAKLFRSLGAAGRRLIT